MSANAISTFQRVQNINIGPKSITVRNALNCACHSNPIVRLYYKIICFLKTGQNVNKKKVVVSLQGADALTLRKVDHLFKKAKSLAETASKSTDAKEKKAAEAFSKNKKNNEVFLALLQDEWLSRFAGKNAEAQALVKTLPANQKEMLADFARRGMSAELIATIDSSQTSIVEMIKKKLEVPADFKNDIDTFLMYLSASPPKEIPPIPVFLKMLQSGLFELIQNKIKKPEITEDPIKTVTFKNIDPTLPDETILAAPKPTCGDDTAQIIKRALSENSSHIIALGLPSYLPAKKGEEQKLGNSPITLKLQEHTYFKVDPQDDTTLAFSRTFLVTDSSVKEGDQPLQRTIEVLIYPNWESTNPPRLNEMKAFIQCDRQLASSQPDGYQTNPIVIGTKDLANAGTYITLRQTLVDNGQVAVGKNIRFVGKTLGKDALPSSQEEMASIFAFFKPDNLDLDLPLLKPFKVDYTYEEFYKAIWAVNNPGMEITPTQLNRMLFRDNITKDLKERTRTSPHMIRTFARYMKEDIRVGDSAWQKILREKTSAYGVPCQLIPEAVEEAITEFKKFRSEKFAALAKELFKDLSGEALKAKEIQLIEAFANTDDEDFIKNPDHHALIKVMLNHKISIFELRYLVNEFFPDFIIKLSDTTKNKINLDSFIQPLDMQTLAKDPAVFEEILTVLLEARNAAKA